MTINRDGSLSVSSPLPACHVRTMPSAFAVIHGDPYHYRLEL
ncbi:MAG: hypothetical protein CSYNP_00365 [Syntrophus sp. SKADARSKE-3]|nr:hypothetical protein [Syntrophus sp. SKADARSKE-3]